MAANSIIGLNQIFPIYNENGTSFHDLVLRKGVVDSIVMSLGDKITGDVFYKDNTLQVTMKEYVVYNGIHYSLVNPPTIIREGMVADNGELKGMTKYSFEFYHPMCQLSNFPFTDVATKTGEEKYLSQNKTFSWIGKPQDYIDKLNKNLQGTVWYVRKSDRFPVEKDDELSEVQQFDNVSVAEAIKRGYEIWGIPYIVSQLPSDDPLYAQGKRFVVEYGLPSNEIYESESARQLDTPFVFQMGQGVGLKNNSRTPRNNKIVTRIAGYGSEDNVPYGYPQIVWTGNQDWDYTINNDPNNPLSYPIYKGIVGGQYVKLIKHPFTRTHLMPSIFTETVNKKVNPNAVGYDPTIEIKDYYDAVATQEYPYVNEINLQAPSYESHEFADIKPELDADRNTGIVSAVPLNADLTPADHWDDSMDDDGNYLQSYFQITLPQLSFDLYACAAITQEMQINMRSGACIGCTFPVQVDWDDYKRNFYDEDGNFVPDGQQRDLIKYPKSNLGQISVIVQKDNNTFGTLMPNIYQQPKANDLFVFIGISLPLSYIANAEERLDDAMKTYMLENNVYYFDYPLKFDEHFLATHTYILEQIRPNSIIHFDYGGVEQQLFVKQITVKYGNAQLPQYDITLTDNIEVVLNQIGQVADDVEKLSSLISILRQSYSRNVWNELAKKLSKVQDDTAQGFITMLKGLQVGAQFTPDILGEGGVFRMGSDGKVELVTDRLYARVSAYFDNVEIRDYRHSGGNRIASQAQGFTCSRVEWWRSGDTEPLKQTQTNLPNVDFFRCFWRVDDGEKKTDNQFIIGDLAFCESAEVESNSLTTKRYWRVVTGRNSGNSTTEDGEAWIDVSNAHNANGTPKMTTITYQGQGGVEQTMSVLSFESGSAVPSAKDDVCQLGDVRDTTRQGAIIEYVTGIDAPSYQIFQGIGSDATNPYSLTGKNYIGLGYDSSTGRAYMNVFGDFYFGDKPVSPATVGNSYIKYNAQTKQLDIKARINAQSTIGGDSIEQYIKDHQNNYDDTAVLTAIGGLEDTTEDLQRQIDGAIETWFMTGVPTLLNAPAVDWTTDDEKDKHIGDLYYDKATGHGYRFMYDDEEHVYLWTILTDEDVTEALRIANEAQATADGKMTIYSTWGAWIKSNVNTLQVGDLYIPASNYTDTSVTPNKTYYAKKVYKCKTDATNDFEEINYTDDSALLTFLDGYSGTLTTIKSQIDEKAETWYQNTVPTWSDDNANHVGDLWYCTADIANTNYKKDTTWYYDVIGGTTQNPTYEWKQQNIPQSVFDTLDGKRAIYVTWSSIQTAMSNGVLQVRDLYIPSSTTTKDNKTYTKNKVYRCTNVGAYSGGAITTYPTFVEIAYTDDTAFNDYITQILNGTIVSSNPTDSQAVANVYNAIKAALGNGTIIDGGLVLTSFIGLRDSNNVVWSGINGVYNAQPSGTGYKGHGIAAWYGGRMADWEVYYDSLTPQQQSSAVITDDYAKSLFRFDGSGYVAGGNLTWDNTGKLTVKQVYWGDEDLTKFFNSFNVGLVSDKLLITPKGDFSILNVLNDIKIGGTLVYDETTHTASITGGSSVATQSWVGSNYVTQTFFKKLFAVYNASGTDITSSVMSGGTLPADATIKALRGLWTDAFLSALGLNPDSGGGGGGSSVLYGLLDVKPNDANNKVYGLDGTADNGKVLTYSTTYNKWIAAPTAETYTLPAATSAALGGIKIGYSASGTNYAVKLDSSSKAYVTVPSYSLPTASSSTKGGVKVGNTLAISSAVLDLASGVIGTTGTYRSVTVDTYGRVTEGTNPTTLSGYGLTDDANITNGVIKLGSNTITPVTNVSLSGDVLMLTKGGSTSDAFKILERRYTVSYPQATFTTAGWYRIGNITLKAGAGASCLLFLNRAYNYHNNESYVFAITVAYNGGITISQIAGHYNSLLIDKIRVTYVSDNTNYYPNIDIHFKETKAGGNALYATIVGAGHVLATSEVVYEPALDSSESTYTFDCVDGGGTSRNYTVCGTLSVGDSIPLSSTTSKRRIYFGDTSHYIELDSNGYFHFSHGLYSDGFVSALGLNDSGSGGGGGGGATALYELVDTTISSPTSNQALMYDGSTNHWVNRALAAADIPNLPWSKITSGKPTTLSGYGITDAYTKTQLESLYMRISAYTDIGATADNNISCNTLTTYGVYGISSSDNNAAYVTDRPTTNKVAFRLIVERSGFMSNPFIRQRYQEYTSSIVYERYSINTGSSWSSWVKVQDNLANYASASYFDSSGNANSALKLTTTSKTAWGRTYWTSGGVPQDISGSMTDVGNITCDNARGLYTKNKPAEGETEQTYSVLYLHSNNDLRLGYGIAGANYDTYIYGSSVRLHYSSSRSTGLLLNSSGDIGIGTTSPTYKLHVAGTFRASGNSSIGGTLGVTGATTLSSTLDVTGATTLSSTLAVTGTSTLTGLLTANGNIKTGKLYLYKPNSDDTNAVYLTCDSSHNVHLVNGGFYSDSFVSALGLNSSGGGGGGGGGGGVGDVTWELLASNSDTRYIAPSHLIYGEGTSDFTDGTEVLSSYVSDSGFQNATYGGRTYRRSALKMWNYIKSKADSVYLPLSGGTMTGSIVMGTNNYIKGANESNGSIIYFDGTRTIVGSVGATSTAATHIRSITGHATIGTSTTASYTVWDSGNDGASSGLDADLLDGQHGSYYATASDVTTLQGYFDSSGAASKAVQLKTARNIWGQSFDGSAAVKGTLYMISDESGANVNSASAKIKFNSASTDSNSVTNSPYIQGVITGLSGITYGRKRLGFFQCNDTDWGGTYTEALSILPNANIGIGTTSPSNLLDVNGTIGILNSGTEKGKIYSTDSAFAIYSAASTEIDLCYGGDSTKAVVLNSAAFKPYNAATGALDLGTTAARWKGIYGTTLNISSTSTFSNLVTLYRETTTSDDFSAGLTFSVKDTTTGKTYSSAYIRSYQDHASTPAGMNMVIRPGGNLFLGGGEAAAAHYALKVGSTTENTYITSDNYVYIQANGNTMANRKGIYIGTSGIIYPCAADTATNAAASLGSSSYRFNEINGTVLNISGDTTLSGHVYMANNKYIYCKDTGSTNRTVLFLNNSNSFCIGYGTATAGYGTYIYGNSIYLKYGTTYSDGLVVHADGYVRAFVGFYSDSYVSALGQNTSSDKRLKDIRGNVTLSIADIANAPSVKYLWKNKDLGLQAGSIAQYWQNVLPECVHEDTDGYLSMEYGVIALLASIATAKKVRDHEKRILELERENERLRTEVEQLKA